MRKRFASITVAALATLSACGGGGSDSPPPSPAAGIYERSGSTSPADVLLVLDSGRSYVFYGFNATTAAPVQGVAVMTLTAAGTSLSANDVRDFNVSAGMLKLGSASGTLAAASSISGSIVRSDSSTLSFGGGYDASSANRASLSDLAGNYAGQMSNLAASQAAVMTADSSGVLAGSATGGCSWVGLAAPHAAGRAFDITMTFGSGCVESGTTLRGHGLVSHGVLYLAVVHDDAPRVVVFAGAKT
jgi:hypothetical protein